MAALDLSYLTKRTAGRQAWSYSTGAEEQKELISQYQKVAEKQKLKLPPVGKTPSLLEKLLGFVSAGETAPAVSEYLKTGSTGGALKKYGQTAAQRLGGAGYGEEPTYSDVLKQLGMKEEKIAGPITTTAIAGLALDILLDPTTYIGGALVKGGGKLIGKPIAKAATKAPVIGKPISAAAKTLEELFVPFAKIKRLPGEVGEKYAEQTFKPFAKGLRYEQKQAVEEIAKLSLKARKKYGEEIGQKLASAIESGKTVKGAEKIQAKITRLFGQIAGEESQRGLLKSELPDYVRHLLTPEAKEFVTGGGKISANYFKPLQIRKAGAAKQRKLLGSIEELNKAFKTEHGFDLFEKDVFKALAGRKVESLKAIRTYDFLKTVEEKFGIKATSGERRIIQDGIEYTEFYPKGKLGFYPLEKGGVGVTKKVSKYLLPKPITEHLEETTKVLLNDEATQEFLKFYDKALGFWKGSVTGWFPAFHGRNFLGGVFNNYIAGVKNPARYWQASKLSGASDEVIELAGKKYTYKELKDIMSKRGAIGEQGWLDVMGTVEGLTEKEFTSSFNKARITLQDYPKEAMNFVENRLRGSLFIDELAKGKSVDDAVKKVFQYHFDYAPEGLTSFERNVMRRLVPFYTWTRNNVPLQLGQMGKQPGKYAGVGKALRTLSGGAETGKEEKGVLPEYMQRSFPIRMGSNAGQVNYVYGLGLPIEDFSNMTVSGVLAKLSPILKVPLELATDKNFYFNVPISDFDSAPQLLQKAPKIIKTLAGYSEVKSGKKTYTTVDPIKWHILSSAFGRYFYTSDKLTDKDVSAAIKFLYATLGLKGKAIDIEKQRYYKSKETSEKLGKFLYGKGAVGHFESYYVPKE
ncbi:MAG TPA: hypothetical protein VMW25_01445 [Clostridia bacterium]|nr:hypothetical protein [Clostridia bacterium]